MLNKVVKAREEGGKMKRQGGNKGDKVFLCLKR